MTYAKIKKTLTSCKKQKENIKNKNSSAINQEERYENNLIHDFVDLFT